MAPTRYNPATIEVSRFNDLIGTINNPNAENFRRVQSLVSMVKQYRQALDSGAGVSNEMKAAFQTSVKTIMGAETSDFKGNAQGLIAKGLTSDDLYEIGFGVYGLAGVNNPFSALVDDMG